MIQEPQALMVVVGLFYGVDGEGDGPEAVVDRILEKLGNNNKGLIKFEKMLEQ